MLTCRIVVVRLHVFWSGESYHGCLSTPVVCEKNEVSGESFVGTSIIRNSSEVLKAWAGLNANSNYVCSYS